MCTRRSTRQRGRAILIAAIAISTAIAISACGSSEDAPNEVRSAADVTQMLDGIPQQGMTLGEPNALVTLAELGQLPCQTCKKYAEDVLPQIIANQVRSGEARLGFGNFVVSGPQSAAAGAAAVAAGEQGRAWNYIELFYLEQGAEAASAITDAALTALARRAGVPNIAKWNRERKSKRVAQIVEATTARAESLAFSEPPVFAALGPATYGEFREPLHPDGSVEQLETAIAKAAVISNTEQEGE